VIFVIQNIIIRNMKKNMGTADRIIRLIVAAIFAILYFTKVINGILGIILLIIAGIFVLTSIIAFCPLYLPFGIKTTRPAKKEE
jgi:hypothetical protein